MTMTRQDSIHSQPILDLLNIRAHPIPVRNNKENIPAALDWPQNERPDHGGVYAFWWRKGLTDLLTQIENHTVAFHGPGGQDAEVILLTVNECDFNECNGMVPLYIGKTQQSIATRVGQHLLLKTPWSIPRNLGHGMHKRKTTACQVRDRFDRLFHSTEDTRSLLVENLALSWVEIDCWKQRFFFEVYAIGHYRPLFNLDCER